MIKTYPIHELAGLVPMAIASEQAVLTKEIEAENGLLLPIILWKGAIVDGRCRQLACIKLGIELRVEELPDSLSESVVAQKVKALNSRRNLTTTQKVMAACRESLTRKSKVSIIKLAKSWGIGKEILKNARYIANVRPELIDPLFNGKSVKIVASDGSEMESNKVSTIYASIRRIEEADSVVETEEHGWTEDGYIKTQRGKDWYYQQVQSLGAMPVGARMHIAELANYKFCVKETVAAVPKAN